jgi:hypothetical protein
MGWTRTDFGKGWDERGLGMAADDLAMGCAALRMHCSGHGLAWAGLYRDRTGNVLVWTCVQMCMG